MVVNVRWDCLHFICLIHINVHSCMDFKLLAYDLEKLVGISFLLKLKCFNNLKTIMTQCFVSFNLFD